MSSDFQQGYQDHSIWEEQSSTKGAGKNGYPQAKECSSFLTLHHIQKSTQNGLKIDMLELNYKILRT